MADQESDRIARLEGRVAEQQQVIDRLLDREAARRPAVTNATTASPADPLSRRSVLRRALVAGSAVVAGSAALAVVDAAPAAAAPSSPSLVAAGQTTTDATTVVYGSSAGSAYPHGILAVTDTTFDASAPVFGWGGAINGYGGPALQIGVSGYGDFTGVRASSTNGAGLFALGATGVHAESTTGPAVSAVGGTASATAAISAYTRARAPRWRR
jgi:hypothetical protein